MTRIRKGDTELVRALVARWDHDTVRALAAMVRVGIAATDATDVFAPDPDTRALVNRARAAVETLDRANQVRRWIETSDDSPAPRQEETP